MKTMSHDDFWYIQPFWMKLLACLLATVLIPVIFVINALLLQELANWFFNPPVQQEVREYLTIYVMLTSYLVAPRMAFGLIWNIKTRKSRASHPGELISLADFWGNVPLLDWVQTLLIGSWLSLFTMAVCVRFVYTYYTAQLGSAPEILVQHLTRMRLVHIATAAPLSCFMGLFLTFFAVYLLYLMGMTYQWIRVRPSNAEQTL